MKTITLTKDEIETLYDYLWCNPCNSGCVHGYTRINCDDLTGTGEFRCKLRRNLMNILRKLEE